MAARQAALGLLHAQGVRPIRVAARCASGVVTVDITLPAGAPRVQQVRLRLR